MPENSLTHSQRLRAAATSRKAMIDNLAGRFTIDEQGVLVNNGLSTYIICFPSDLDPTRRKFLRKKIASQLETTAAFKDIEELHALECVVMPDKGPADPFLSLGLYLYFADECSRLGKQKSFLTAMRQAGATLNRQDGYYPSALYEKTKKALEILGMEPAHFNVLKQWYETGTFTVYNELHTPTSLGTYGRLAEKMSPDGRWLGINQAISFAFANAEKIKGMTPEESLRHTQNLLQHPEEIKKIVQDGNNSRVNRLITEIAKKKKLGILPKKAQINTGKEARAILEYLPEAALEILYQRDHIFAYAHKEDISSIFPKEGLPHLSHDGNESLRAGKGLRLSPRYNMIFISDGRRLRNPGDVKNDPELRAQVAAQTLLHESLHEALAYIQPSGDSDWNYVHNPNPFRDAVKAVSAELAYKKQQGTLPSYFNNKLRTMDVTTLADAINYTFSDYNNYVYRNERNRTIDTRWEEVMCQIFSLMHTEYPYPPEPGKPNPYADLPALGKLAETINQALSTARVKCREQHPDIKLPSASLPAH